MEIGDRHGHDRDPELVDGPRPRARRWTWIVLWLGGSGHADRHARRASERRRRWRIALAAATIATALAAAGAVAWCAAPLGAVLALGAEAGLRAAHRHQRPARSRRIPVLQRAIARRDQHLARTVHELRTPLATVVAALELLRGDWLAPGHEAETVLADAALAARHLTDLIDDVLDDAAMKAGRLRLRPAAHDVADLLADSERLLRLHAERSGVRLETSVEGERPTVHTDARRFQQIVCNLAGNAFRAAPAGTAVRLCAQAVDGRVRFAVVDQGPGIDGDVRPRLFEPFATGASPRGARGTGLGLFVCSRLVHHLGGRLGHARHDGGTEFWFELPSAVPDRGARNVAPSAGAPR